MSHVLQNVYQCAYQKKVKLVAEQNPKWYHVDFGLAPQKHASDSFNFEINQGEVDITAAGFTS